MLDLILLHEQFILPDMNFANLMNLLMNGPNSNEICNVFLYSKKH